MKKMIVAAGLLALSTFAVAQSHYVSGYVKSNGTYVSGHYSSNANSVRYDNPSSKTMGGTHRDEFSSPSATNKRNPSYGSADNDNDGVPNAYDSSPNRKGN